MVEFVVVEYSMGVFLGVVAGMGKNRETWDCTHSRASAYRHAAELKRELWRALAGYTYNVEASA